MTYNNTKLKELPKDIKFATFNSKSEDIILGEYLIATLIYNGASFNQILECANEIKNVKKRKDTKTIIAKIALDFINLNPSFVKILNRNYRIHQPLK